MANNLGNGFQFTVAVADTVQHVLTVYVDVSQGTGNLNASFNDGVTPDYNDSSVSNLTSVSTGAYTITYQAIAAPATLTVTYTLQSGNGSGTAVASDTFDRADGTGLGTASDGKNTWTLNTITGSPAWAIKTKQAVMSGASADTSIALLGTGILGDCEALCTIEASNIADRIGVILRASAKATSYYLATLTNSTLTLFYHASGSDITLKSASETYKINTQYNIRFRCVNQTLYARFWLNDGSQEPTNWHVTAQDNHLTSGQYGIYGLLSSTSDVCTFDTYSAVDLSGSVTPTAYVGLHAASIAGTVVAPTSDALSAATSTPSTPVDITAEGTNDWAKWGKSGAASFDHKSGVTQQIFTYTSQGSGTPTQNASAIVGYSWSDGTPTASATNSTTEASVQGVNNGFQITATADTISRVLNIYVTATKAQGKLTATLSDDSGGVHTYTDSSLNDSGTGTAKKYAITYNAASANQTLTVTWIMLKDNGGGGGTTTTYSSDTYTRANAASWSTSSGGETWTQTAVSGTPSWSISSNKGQITSSNTATANSLLGTQTQLNAEALILWQVSSPANDTVAIMLRKTGSTTFYRVEISAGNLLEIIRRVTGTDTALTPTATISYVANTAYWTRFRVNGSNLYANFWASDGSNPPTNEPAGWTLSCTDSSPITGAGGWGLRTITHAGDTVTFDNYTVTSLPSGGTPGSIGLGAATLVGNASNALPPPPPPTPNQAAIPITVNASDVLTSPWFGYGVEMDAYDHGTGVPIGITSAQRALINTRLDDLDPQIIRTSLGNVSWWCPGGVVGTYNFTTAIMQEWYNVLDYAQNNNIPVIVSLLSPSPFTATSTSWCTAFADLLSYLTGTAGYTVVNYTTGLSQPDTLGLSYSQYKTTVEPQLVAALNANSLGLAVTLLGPDTTQSNDSWLTSASTDLASSLQGYARQAFPTGIADISNDSKEGPLRTLVNGINTNDPTGKLIIQTEMGFAALGPGANVATYQYGLEMGDFAVQVARAGMSAGIAYLLDDDMRNTQWGMFKITDTVPSLRPWFFVWNILCGTITASTSIYACAQPSTNDFRVLGALSPQGIWSFVLVNRNANAQKVSITVPTAPTATTMLQQYIYSSVAPLLVDTNGFPLSSGSIQGILNRGITVSMAGSSILVLTQQSALQSTAYNVKQPPLQKRQ